MTSDTWILLCELLKALVSPVRTVRLALLVDSQNVMLTVPLAAFSALIGQVGNAAALAGAPVEVIAPPVTTARVARAETGASSARSRR